MVMPVSTLPTLVHKPPQLRFRGSCLHGDAAARSTPPPIAVRTRIAGTGGGRDGGISAPTAIPMGDAGASCCASSVTATFSRLGTILYGKHASVELIVRVIACLAEGLGIQGTARVFEIDPNTVLGWLVEAAEQLHAFSSSSRTLVQRLGTPAPVTAGHDDAWRAMG